VAARAGDAAREAALISDIEHAFEPATIDPRRLRFFRAAWLVLVALTLVAVLLAVPARYAELMTPSGLPDHAMQQLSAEEFFLLGGLHIKPEAYATAVIALEILLLAVFFGLGIVLFVRESSSWLGMYVSLALITYAAYATPTLDALLDGPAAAAWLSRFVQTIGLQAALTFFFLFPDGRFVPRWTILMAFAWLIAMWSAFFFPGVPWDFLDPWGLSATSFALLMAAWATGLVAQALRYRQTPSLVERQQTKWVLYSVLLAVIGYAITFIPHLVLPYLNMSPAPSLAYNALMPVFFYAAILSIPVAMTFSILRYRLWDIDRLIGQTLLYGLTSAALVAIYAGVVLVTVVLVGWNTSLGPAPIVLTTIAVALIAQPLRDRLQDFIDRRFFRAKYDAEQTVDFFGRSARDTVDLHELTASLSDTVETALHPEHISVWIRPREASGVDSSRASS
jgi:hypothetical protein